MTFVDGASTSSRREVPVCCSRSADDHPELLRVRRAGCAFGERGGHAGRYADSSFAVLGFEDVGEVPRRGDPGCDDRLGSRKLVGTPREVLADYVAVAWARHVASATDAVYWRLAAGRDVREVVIGDQFLAVTFGSLFELRAGL